MSKAPRTLLLPRATGRYDVANGERILVAGGGIAGVAAATVLAERGVEVTLVEQEHFLGGRAGAWTETLADGESFEMERGFHAFFRQYYNLRALLRRIDPELSFLVPMEDYPIHGPGGALQSFSDLPTATPRNLISLVRRSPALGLLDLVRVNKGRALEMLTYDGEKTYRKRDDVTAAEYLDSLDFPDEARRLFFDVFAHSFFNPEEEMSAGELLMMFHFYFTGNPEGLVFDVSNAPFSTAVWKPFEEHLRSLGVEIRFGTSVESVERRDGVWHVRTTEGAQEVDGVVLALSVEPLQHVVASSPTLDDSVWRESVAELALTHPFAVWRLWLDRPTEPGRDPFIGTTGLGPLDNISLYHLFEDESRAWAERHGGAVVELHAYAIDPEYDEAILRDELLAGMHELYPETKGAGVVEERFLVRQDCPAFAPGSYARRPTVDTPFDGLTLAGDLVRLPVPSALMERAAASGFLAANHILDRSGVRSEPIHSVRDRGLLAALNH